jgi:hypothetical protein
MMHVFSFTYIEELHEGKHMQTGERQRSRGQGFLPRMHASCARANVANAILVDPSHAQDIHVDTSFETRLAFKSPNNFLSVGVRVNTSGSLVMQRYRPLCRTARNPSLHV